MTESSTDTGRRRPTAGDGTELLTPASDLQRDWWYRENLHPNPDLVIVWPSWLSGPVDLPALRRAVARLVERHESLRTTFTEHGGVPTQVVHPAPDPRDDRSVPLWTEDLRNLDADGRRQRLTALVEREQDHRYDLRTGPLVRIGLVRVSDTESLLVLGFHHIVIDGTAVDAVFQELSALQLAATGEGPDVPAGPVRQLRDWVADEQAFSGSVEARAQLDHWRARLEGLTPLRLPYDRPPTDPVRFVAAERRFTIPGEVADGLRAVARRARASLFAASLTGFLALLAELTGRTDVATMCLVHRRENPAARDVVGCLTNAVTLRARMADATPVELIRQVRNGFLEAHSHQDIFVTRVWDAVGLGPGDVDALYIHDEVVAPPSRFGPHAVRPYEHPAPRRYERYGPWWENVKIRVMQTGDGLVGGVLEYNAELYTAGTVDGWCERYVARLRRLAGTGSDG